LFNTMQVETPPPTQIAVHASNMTTGNGGDVLQPRAFPLNNASAHRPSQTSPPAHVNGWMRSKNVRKKHRASMAEARFQHPTRFRSPPPPHPTPHPAAALPSTKTRGRTLCESASQPSDVPPQPHPRPAITLPPAKIRGRKHGDSASLEPDARHHHLIIPRAPRDNEIITRQT
jgi:hypothetical protein